MKITRIMTASAVALTLAFGTAISASAATFDMNTPAITGEGIVLENPGDSITTEGTGEYLVFDSDFTMRWEYKFGEYAEGEYTTKVEGTEWGGVTGFFIDDNGIYRISEWGDNDYFYPDEGCIYVVTYEPATSGDDSSSSGSDYDDCWHIEQIADDRVDLSTADVQVNTTDKTITVVDADGNPVDSGCYTVEFVKGDSSSTEFPTEVGEYTVVVTAAPGARHAKGVNDNAIFTIGEEDESSESTSESTADSSEVTSEDESTSESEAESQADESSEAESTADTSSKADSSSKADASSKAASTASTTNPGTGAAAAMGILAVTTAGVVVTKKKSR